MKNNDVITAAKEARRLIAEVGWCQGFDAKDAQGHLVWALDPEAVCFCVFGAVERAFSGQPIESRYMIDDEIDDELGYMTMGKWNDVEGRTRDEVVAMFERVIAKLEAKLIESAREGDGGDA